MTATARHRGFVAGHRVVVAGHRPFTRSAP
jgi:hypothetical protein